MKFSVGPDYRGSSRSASAVDETPVPLSVQPRGIHSDQLSHSVFLHSLEGKETTALSLHLWVPSQNVKADQSNSLLSKLPLPLALASCLWPGK